MTEMFPRQLANVNSNPHIEANGELEQEVKI